MTKRRKRQVITRADVDNLPNDVYRVVIIQGFRKLMKEQPITPAVMTEARRLARQKVKDAIRALGGRLSHYEAKEITKAADRLMKEDRSFIIQAQINLRDRSAA